MSVKTMNKTQIVEEIYKKQIPEKISNSIRDFLSLDDKRDYIQEMYLILMELPEDKFFRLYRDKVLSKYFAQICITQLTVKDSAFYQKLRGRIDTISLEQLLITLEDENQEN